MSGKPSAVLTRVDQLLLQEYAYLKSEDECYFLREYTAGAGYQHSDTNNLISNLKKEPDRRGKPEWYWKERAIQRFAQELNVALLPGSLSRVTLVPIPPSKAQDDPMYDDRIVQVLRALQQLNRGAHDVRELLFQSCSTRSAHHRNSSRLRTEEIYTIYRIRPELLHPEPQVIAVIDDLLTTGAHFKAAQQRLLEALPGCQVRGIFLARTIHPS